MQLSSFKTNIKPGRKLEEAKRKRRRRSDVYQRILTHSLLTISS
jgi:hypothetical protein